MRAGGLVPAFSQFQRACDSRAVNGTCMRIRKKCRKSKCPKLAFFEAEIQRFYEKHPGLKYKINRRNKK